MKLFAYRYIRAEGPEWGPLESIVERTVRRRDVHMLDADDFAYGGHLVSLDGRPDMHLYKHGVTRGYLNVDDRLRLYGYVDGDRGPYRSHFERAVYYCRHRSLAVALDCLGLHLCGWQGAPAGSGPDNVVSIWRARRGAKPKSIA